MRPGLALAFVLAAALAGCEENSGGGDAPAATPPPPPPAPAAGSVLGVSVTPNAELQAIAARLDAVLGLGYNTVNSDAVMKQLSGLDPAAPASKLVVVDTRERADFAKGHIPGAINVPLGELPRALREGTSGIPADKDVAVASYWGDDGNMGSFLINVARVADPANKAAYPKSLTIFQGMTSWSFTRDLVPPKTRFDDSGGAVTVHKPLETGTVAPVTRTAFPVFAPFEIDEVVHKVLVRAERYLGKFASQLEAHLHPKALADFIEDGSSENDPQIVCVRSAAHYAGGHIPGAINVPYQQVARLSTYTKFIDPQRRVVVSCYTGHTGALATIALGVLGYEAVNLLYGMAGWSLDAPGGGQLRAFDVNRAWDFPLHDWGSGIGSLLTYDPPSAGCKTCHTSLTAIWRDMVEDPPPASSAPPSSGEG